VDVGPGRDSGLERCPAAGNEHVDVGPDDRPGVHEAVAQPGKPSVDVIDDLGDRSPLGLEEARRAREERDERAGQVNGGAQRIEPAQPTTAASTDQIAGRFSAASDHVRPSSALANTWPLLVPK